MAAADLTRRLGRVGLARVKGCSAAWSSSSVVKERGPRATPSAGRCHAVSPSLQGSELITRTILTSAAVLGAAGLPPAAVLGFMRAGPSASPWRTGTDPTPRAISSPAPGSSADQVAPDTEPTCLCCTIPNLTGEASEELCDVLLGLGAQSVMVQEFRGEGRPEQEIFDEGKSGRTELWDHCTVVAYFALEHDVASTLDSACEILPHLPRPLPHTMSPVANQMWVDQIKASYVPLQITSSLYIIPEWAQPEVPSAINVVLQPGVAFGTGEHPTTRLCLRELSAMQLSGVAVVDYGAGSGVLAIAALLMGAQRAACTDVDGLAVRAAARNAELNGVQDRMAVHLCGPSLDDPEPLAQAGDRTASAGFDLVVANILRGPLVELQPRLAAYARPGATLLLSGILEEQVPDVMAAYTRDFEGFQVTTEGSWACVRAVRRST